MCLVKTQNSQPLISYLPASLKYTAHGWTIEYRVFNPAFNAMERRVIKMNRIRKKYSRVSDFKAYCADVITRLNTQLATGWNPFEGCAGNSRELTPINAVLDKYLVDKAGDVRPDTLINYRSFVKVFKEWVENNYGKISISGFNRVMATNFMDFIVQEKGLHGRSYNNRLKQARAFFTYAIEKFYCKENPFSTIKTKREEGKKRIMVPHEVRKEIYKYWSERNENYIVLCELVFSALIRPKECWRLHVSDLMLADRYIEVSEDDSKTHYRRSPSLTPELVTRLEKMTRHANKSDYLFSDGYMPGKKQIAYSRFRKDWQDMREALGLPDEMQLYSLRDTGINEMLKGGIDALSVMQHADHHDLSITTRYANHADPRLVDTISTKAPAFSREG
jgi:site-specific recombinase XerD